MSFGIDERTPLLLCTDSGSVRKILACKISNGRVEQTETVPYNKMGFTSKRCCNDLMTVDQFGVISRFQLNGMTMTTPLSQNQAIGANLSRIPLGSLNTYQQNYSGRQITGTYGNSNTLDPNSAYYLQTPQSLPL